MKQKYIIDRGCTACDECRWLCPVHAISLDLKGAHIDQEKCIGCGVCMKNCPSEAIRPLTQENQPN